MRNYSALLVLVIGILCLLSASSAYAVGGGDITFKLTKMDNVIFSHDYHIKTRGIHCQACHLQKFSKGVGNEMKKELMTKRDFCVHCHNGMKSFDVDSEKNCVRCHKK